MASTSQPTLEQLDGRDREILERRAQAIACRERPGVGDFVEYPDGTVRRISYDWFGEDFQSSDLSGLTSGSYYLGENGHVSYSGGLHPSAPIDTLEPTGETREGGCWFFHRDVWGAGRGVDVRVPFRVWRSVAGPTGLPGVGYRVVNTETGEALSPVFGTLGEAKRSMLEHFPVVEPWDGVEVPVGVEEVKA